MSEAQAGARPSTAAYDPRFPYTNVTKMCWTNYVDFHRCARVKGSEDDAACAVFKKNFKAVCLESWVEKSDAQREAGVFPGQQLINN